jgi:nucleoside-diphosphate-sugar epimerase
MAHLRPGGRAVPLFSGATTGKLVVHLADRSTAALAACGATPAVADLYDRPTVAGLLSNADGAIHTASPGDATSADLDSAVVDAGTDAFAGSGKTYIHTSGVWIYGANPSISEESPFDAPALVSWREPIERRLLDASGMRGVVVVSSVAYGDGGGGIPGLLLGSPRDDAGNLIMLGTGQQHWSTMHVADLADAFRRVLEDDSARGYYLIGNGSNSTVAELTQAAAVAAGAPGAELFPPCTCGGNEDAVAATIVRLKLEAYRVDRRGRGTSPTPPFTVDARRRRRRVGARTRDRTESGSPRNRTWPKPRRKTAVGWSASVV